MIKISSNSDKRSDIVEAWYAEPTYLDFVDYPGNYCQCTGDFEQIKFTSASITEDEPENGAPVNQEIQIFMRGQNSETDDKFAEICGKYIILKLIFSNGDVKIVGVPNNPVVLSALKSEKPLATTLSVSRTSAEKSKYLLV
jgi:hypothetical protein